MNNRFTMQLIRKLTILCFVTGWLIAFGARAEMRFEGFRAGDLIFRQGTEFVSQLVNSVDQGKYSHVGMIIGKAPDWQVIHATPSEVEGRPNSVVIDDLAFFIDPARASEFAIFRVSASERQHQRAVEFATAQLHQPFSMDPSQGTYCSLLVWDAWQRADVDLDVKFSPIQLPFLSGNYLLPNVLSHSRQLTLIYAFVATPKNSAKMSSDVATSW